MKYLVDGYNLIFSTDLKDNGIKEAVEKLTAMVQGLGDSVLVIFDGREGVDLPHKSWVHFTKGKSADEYIVDYVKSSKDPQSIKVVTRDKGVVSRVKMYGAKVLDPRDFLKELSRLRKRTLYIKGVITREEAREITEELKKLWVDEEGGTG